MPHSPQILKLPRQTSSPETWQSLIAKTKQLRLEALKTSPTTFASTYAVEVEFDIQKWHDRLLNPAATHFVSIETPTSDANPTDSVSKLLNNAWQGVLVMLEERDEQPAVSSANHSPWDALTALEQSNALLGQNHGQDQEKSVLHYHMSGFFVRSQYRGRGVGTALIEAAIKHGDEQRDAMEREQCHYTLVVDDYNTSAIKAYEKCGFAVFRKEEFTPMTPGGFGGNGEKRTAVWMERRTYPVSRNDDV